MTSPYTFKGDIIIEQAKYTADSAFTAVRAVYHPMAQRHLPACCQE